MLGAARWIVVADSTEARFYEFTPAAQGSLSLRETLERPQSREHSRDLIGNRPNQNQHQMERTAKGNEPQSLRDDESRVFARQVSDLLSLAHATNRFRELVVVADPRFLGMLRATLSPPVAAAITATIAKHALRLEERQLGALIAAEL